jgi:ubiquinone/menaquinone biosynthesis C-methylase UbiE
MTSRKGKGRSWLAEAYLWATEQLYGPLAWAYDAVAWVVSFGYWQQWRLDALRYLQPGAVLEVGFGTGELLLAMAEQGCQVTGLEPSAQMHKVTARKLRRRKENVSRVRGNAEAIPLAAGSFANVIITFPSNYILREATLGEIYRVLNIDGYCVVVGWSVHFKSSLLRMFTKLWLGAGVELAIDRFTQTARGVGFKVNRVTHRTDSYTLPVVVLQKHHD